MPNTISTVNQHGSSIEIPYTHTHIFSSNSNVSPPAKTYTCVQSLVQTPLRELATHQDGVSHLEQCSGDVRRHHPRTVTPVDGPIQPHVAFTPIKRLPPEIISEIFERCLEGHLVYMPSKVPMRSKVAPLLLGRVCRTWRAVANGTPRLWQDISINVCEWRYSHELNRDVLPVLQMWLARSGSLPLNLVMQCKAERVLPGMMDLFETIAAHGTRWKNVHIRLQNAGVIHRLVCRSFSQCTSLSTFDVTDGGQSRCALGAGQPDGVQEMEPISFNLSLSPLRHLSLSLAGLTIHEVHAPWVRLTRLFFMHDTRSSMSFITDYVAILKQCAMLKECGITIDSGIRDAPSLEPFILPNLESLHVQVLRRAASTTQLGDFLDVLDAPRLTALTIEDSCLRQDAILYHNALKAFLRGHAKRLRHLKLAISSKFFTSQDMVALIGETPSLTELEYEPDEESSPRGLLEALTPRVQDDLVECMLPCLERLFVYWDTTETVSMVGDMVEKRYALAEEAGIVRLGYLSCKPVKMNLVKYGVRTDILAENLTERLGPLRQRGLQLDWKGYIYDAFLYC